MIIQRGAGALAAALNSRSDEGSLVELLCSQKEDGAIVSKYQVHVPDAEHAAWKKLERTLNSD